jgi:diguanylate cyclase (GGDEF)-like protein
VIDFRGEKLGNLTISIGVAAFPYHGESGEEVIHAADMALYQAKQKGRNRVIVAPLL